MEFYYSAVQFPLPRVPEASTISNRYLITVEECSASDNITFIGDDKIFFPMAEEGRQKIYLQT
jgi:hypothetical protein